MTLKDSGCWVSNFWASTVRSMLVVSFWRRGLGKFVCPALSDRLRVQQVAHPAGRLLSWAPGPVRVRGLSKPTVLNIPQGPRKSLLMQLKYLGPPCALEWSPVAAFEEDSACSWGSRFLLCPYELNGGSSCSNLLPEANPCPARGCLPGTWALHGIPKPTVFRVLSSK